MIRTTLAIAYFSYLLVGGNAMVGGLKSAEHTNASAYQQNICKLMQAIEQCS